MGESKSDKLDYRIGEWIALSSDFPKETQVLRIDGFDYRPVGVQDGDVRETLHVEVSEWLCESWWCEWKYVEPQIIDSDSSKWELENRVRPDSGDNPGLIKRAVEVVFG